MNENISILEVSSQSPVIDRLLPLLNKADEYFSNIENSVYDDCTEPLEYYDKTIVNENMVVYAEDKEKGDIAGVLLLKRWNTNFIVVYLNDLWVQPRYRGRGIATRLVERAIQLCRADGRHIELGWLENGGDGKHFWKSFIERHRDLKAQKLHTWIALC